MARNRIVSFATLFSLLLAGGENFASVLLPVAPGAVVEPHGVGPRPIGFAKFNAARYAAILQGRPAGSGKTTPTGGATGAPNTPNPGSTVRGAPTGGRTGFAGAARGARTRGEAFAESTWSSWWERNAETYLRLDLAADRNPVTGPESRNIDPAADPARLESARSALLAGLRNEDLGLAQECLLALARIASSQSKPALLAQIDRLLPKFDEDLRNVAVLALGVIGDSRSAPLLEELVADSDTGRAKTGVPKLDCSTRSAAALALGLLGHAPAAPILLHALGSADCDQFRSSLLLSMANAAPSDPRVVRTLLEELRRPAASEALRCQAAVALSRTTPSVGGPLVPELLGLSRDQRVPDAVRAATLLAIGRLGDLASPETLQALRSGTSSPAPAVREAAWIALGRMLERDPDVASHHELRGSCLGHLLHAAQFPDQPLDRPWAALAAGLAVRAESIDSPRRVTVCQELLSTLPSVQTDSERGALLIAAGLTGCSGVSSTAIDLLEQDGDEDLRTCAAQALRLSPDTSIAPRLERLLGSADLEDRTRKEAVRALVSLGGAPQLAAALRDPNRPVRSVLDQTLESLGASRDPAFLPILIERLGDLRSDPLDRAFAARAIGTLAEAGDRECFRPYTEDSDWLLEDPMLEAYLLLE